jgi:ABC-type nitrate/sulfonate/bicarbonate transport system substrate-binding protein
MRVREAAGRSRDGSAGTRLRARFALLAALVVLLPLRAGSEEGWALVRLSFSSGWDALPALVAIERGFFVREKLTVSGLALSSGEAVIKSLATGSTDFASVPQRTLLVMTVAKAPVKVVALSGYGTRTELVVASDSPIAKVADLKGKLIAVGTGAEAYPALIRLLNASGLRPADVTIRSLDGQDLSEVFRQKRADAVCASAHFTARMVTDGQARVLLSNEDIVKAIGLIGPAPLVAAAKLVQSSPDTVQRFVNAWVEALRYIQRDPDDSARILQIFFHRQGVVVPLEQARSWVGMTRFDRVTWTGDDVTDADFNAWALAEGGILKVRPKLEQIQALIDNRFAERALARAQAPAPAE